MRTVTLCGSTKFKEEFQKLEANLSLRGWAVYSCALWRHAGDELAAYEKLRLDAIHMVKIANSDYVYVINKDGYIGESTMREIYFAHAMDKNITFHEPDDELARLWRRGTLVI